MLNTLFRIVNITSEDGLRIGEDKPGSGTIWLLQALAVLFDQGFKLAVLVMVKHWLLASVLEVKPG